MNIGRDLFAWVTARHLSICAGVRAEGARSQVERAYRCDDLFAKRVALMDDWAAFLTKPVAKIGAAASKARPRRLPLEGNELSSSWINYLDASPIVEVAV